MNRRQRIDQHENGYELWELDHSEFPDIYAIKHASSSNYSAKFRKKEKAEKVWADFAAFEVPSLQVEAV